MKEITLVIINQQKQEQLSSIFENLHLYGFRYEVIFVTNNENDLSLQDVEIFPKETPVMVHHEANTSISAMIDSGVSHAKYDFICILGSTDDYLPNQLSAMLSDILDKTEVVAAVPADVASALPFPFKLHLNQHHAFLLFRKYVWDVIKFHSVKDAVFLLEFIKRSDEAGFNLKRYQIPTSANSVSQAHISRFQALFSAAKDIISLAFKKTPPFHLPVKEGTSMINAGLIYKKQKYITHTTLNFYQSAVEALNTRVILMMLGMVTLCGILLFLNPLLFIQTFIGILSCIYLLDVCFNLFLVFKTFKGVPQLSFSRRELKAIDDTKLPVYSILCPLYKEVHILPQFIQGLEKLSWPKDKLDVIILLESDDKESIEKFESMSVPEYMRAIIVPDSFPKTKPKACNYGLEFAKGEYTVIYDAEDIPDPWQLKKAYLGFQKSDDKVACIQAKLNYYNSGQNLLTRFFTAEYSLWFDVVLTSLHSLKTVIPLGGTSNHFRTHDLKRLHAWDPFNVTEDADLGLRLFKLGYHTAILDSVTLEEGNSQVRNWIRQRSRWIKGYMQTYLVHTKQNVKFFKERGIHALIFHLVIGGKLAFIIINPFLWILTLVYFTLYPVVGTTIDSWYPPFVLYVAISSLIFGNYFYLFCYIMGCVKKGKWELIKYVYFIPFYWILISIAGFIALYQLIFKPFYWEKTVHGLHLKNNLPLPGNIPEQEPRGLAVT